MKKQDCSVARRLRSSVRHTRKLIIYSSTTEGEDDVRNEDSGTSGLAGAELGKGRRKTQQRRSVEEFRKRAQCSQSPHIQLTDVFVDNRNTPKLYLQKALKNDPNAAPSQIVPKSEEEEQNKTMQHQLSSIPQPLPDILMSTTGERKPQGQSRHETKSMTTRFQTEASPTKPIDPDFLTCSPDCLIRNTGSVHADNRRTTRSHTRSKSQPADARKHRSRASNVRAAESSSDEETVRESQPRRKTVSVSRNDNSSQPRKHACYSQPEKENMERFKEKKLPRRRNLNKDVLQSTDSDQPPQKAEKTKKKKKVCL